MKLVSGQNAPLRSPTTTLRSSFAPKGAEVDFAAFALGADGRVGDDSAMVFYNQTSAPGIALRDAASGSFDVYVDLLPPSVAKVAVVAVVPETSSFASLGGLVLSAACGDDEWTFEIPVAGSPLRSLVLAEIYRRDGGWKIRALGQGFEHGLADLAVHYGVEVSSGDEPATDVDRGRTAAAPAAPASAPVRETEPWRRRLAVLRKTRPTEAALVLEADAALSRAGLPGASARTILCLDVSTRALAFLSDGRADVLAARMAALAFRLDPSGVLDVVLFGRFAHSFGALDPTKAGTFSADVLVHYGTEDGRAFAPAARMAADLAGAAQAFVLVAAAGARTDASVPSVLPPSLFRATGVFDEVRGEGRSDNLSERNVGAEFDFQPPFGQMVGPWELEQASFAISAASDELFYDELLRHWPRWAHARAASAAT